MTNAWNDGDAPNEASVSEGRHYREFSVSLSGNPVHPAWASVTSQLCDAELACVSMEDWHGMLWGKCTRCNKSIDLPHLRSTTHRLRFRGVAEVDARGPQAGDPRRPPPDGEQARSCADTTCYYPSDYCGHRVHGAFLVDSFYYMKKRTSGGNKYTMYMTELLDVIQRQTGKVFMAVCSGGAALAKPHGSGARYQDLLARVPCGVELIVAVVCGNDLINGRGPVPYNSDLDLAVQSLCSGMQARSSKQYAVVGGSAELWGYDRRLTKELCALYNCNAERLASAFRNRGVESSRGVEELQGVQTSDDIGHVHPDSKGLVFAAYQSWVDRAMSAAR
eukprot:10420315-Karenia_brevis.AAC.1